MRAQNLLIRTTVLLFSLLALQLTVCARASGLEMRGDTIYLIVPDRFADGDPTNNTAVVPGLYDNTRTDWQKFWGGDLAGVKQKLDYLQAVGATTVWVTPVYQNAPVIGTYHGYQMQDLFRVDPHHGSWSTVDGLTCDMHARGVKMMLDISLNSGPSTSAGSPNGSQCLLKKDGVVVARYTQDTDAWFHHNGPIDWNNFTYWDQVNKDIFGLADLNQDNPNVMDYLKQGAALWQYHGVDCFRLDAAKHFEPSRGREWMDAVNQVAGWLGKPGTYAVGEWYSGGAWNSESLWWTSTAGTAQFDFQLEEQLRGVTGEWKSMYDLRDTLNARQGAYGTDGSGGQNVHWQVNFFDSQDTQRLIVPLMQKYNNASEVHQRIAMALGLLEMVPGIPMVFYGTEQYLYNDTVNINGVAGGDPYNRPMMTSFDTSTLAGQVLKKASDLRRVSPAVQYGDIVERWIDSGLFIFSRQAAGSAVLVGVNNGWQSRTVNVSAIPFPNGSYADVLGLTSAINVSNGTASVTVPARSTVIFSYLPNPLSTGPISDGRCSMAPPNMSGPPPSGQIVIDGENIPADFAGKLRATQINPTQFGDSNGSGNGSELNQLFVTNDGTNLYLGATGNLETNGNALLVFLDTGGGTPDPISATTGPPVISGIQGTQMDEGFAPRWVIAVRATSGSAFAVDLVDLSSNTQTSLGSGVFNSGSGALTGGDHPNGELVAFDNGNAAGVTGTTVQDANTASTGIEMKLPFSTLKLMSGTVKVMACITGGSGYFSNQSLPSMGISSSQVVGGYVNLGMAPIDFNRVAGNQYVSVILSGISYQTFSSLSQARLLSDGAPVTLTNQTGIGAFSALGCYYVQDPEEYAGIRVVRQGTLAEIGQKVNVSGFLSTLDGERVLYATTQALGGAAAVPIPVKMGNSSLGGISGGGALGVIDGLGPVNVGLNVSTWGRVTATGTDSIAGAFFYVDDGSHLSDGSVVGGVPTRGIRVYSSFVIPPVGRVVRISGVSSVEQIKSESRPRILTRVPSDVAVID